MKNEQNNKKGQATADKASELVKSAGEKIEQKGNDIAGDTKKLFEEGKEEISAAIETVDKQVRENPWPIIAGVAVGSFLFGFLISKFK